MIGSDILERPETINKLKVAFAMALAAVVIPDFFIHREHVVFPWDGVPGFSAVFGLLSCALIILVSRYMGKLGILKPEDYYD